MNNRWRLIGLMLSAAVLSAGAAVAWHLLPERFPDPATADRAGLVRWIVDRDLAGEPPETRLVLARRLEAAFRDGVDWQAVKRRTTAAQRQRLWANVPLLLEPWLREKAAVYARLNREEGRRFVDGILDAVGRWSGVECLRPQDDAEPTARRRSLCRTLFDHVEAHQRRAEPHERRQLSDLLAAIESRLLARAFHL